MSAILTAASPRVGQIVKLIDAEFHEMPGMRLTKPQVRRLWSLSPGDCEDALHSLCESGQLARDPSGRYLLRRFDD